jgi:hypothetical protein
MNFIGKRAPSGLMNQLRKMKNATPHTAANGHAGQRRVEARRGGGGSRRASSRQADSGGRSDKSPPAQLRETKERTGSTGSL